MKITESKLREMIRGVIREYSSGGGSSGGSDSTEKQDAESGNEPIVSSNVPKYFGGMVDFGKPAKYQAQGSSKGTIYGPSTDSAKPGDAGPWEANPDYKDWEAAMADAKAEDQKATGGQGDQPTGGGAGASTGGKKGKKKKDDE